MQTYIVGGAVRDEILGLPVKDRDYVVVGATPDELLAAGFKPVGKDFPVFLHPTSREEYALARTERKTGPGYHGFDFHAAPDVTLEQDLARRDLTINAMARGEDRVLVDPFGGQRDISARLLRHVGPAFAEDPVRILRVARFAARFADFGVAAETLDLMRQMVASGEVDHLVPERVWQELSKGLMEARPSRMFQVLRDCGALRRLLPELDALFGIPQPPAHHPEVDTGVHVMMVVDHAASQAWALPVRYAAFLHDLGKARTPPSNWPHHYGHENLGLPLVEAVSARLKVSGECRDLAVMASRHHGNIHRGSQLRANTMVRLLEQCDALRRPERFFSLLQVCAADAAGRLGRESAPYPVAELWKSALAAARGVDAGAVARETSDKSRIPQRVQAARVCAVAALRGVSSSAAERDDELPENDAGPGL